MTVEWSKFWIAIAVMALALCASVYASLGKPWDLGSVADWLSGTATLIAVWIALKTAREQGALAVRVAKEDRDERSLVRLKTERQFAKTILFISLNAHANLKIMLDLHEKDPALKGMEKIASSTEICKATTRAFTHLASSAAPSTEALGHLLRLETAYGVAVLAADQRIQFGGAAVSTTDQALRELESASSAMANYCIAIGARDEPSDHVQVAFALRRALHSYA